MSKFIKPIALVVALVIVGGGLLWWWYQQSIYPSTQDAYIHANIVSIVPQIGGKVTTVDAAENAHVNAGDILFRIDSASLQAAVDAAQAQLDIATQNVGAAGAKLSAAEAGVSAAEAALKEANDTYQRVLKLSRGGNASKAALEQASTAMKQAEAQKNSADASLAAARDELGKQGNSNAGVREALANLDRARIALSYAIVRAPAPGWIANLSLRPGQVVGAGESLFSLVEDKDWWVSANFKETDIHRIRPGQSASIGIDMYPGVAVTGRVESIGAGAGAVFSLLPSENATGNWVKVTRRFPVRLSLTAPPSDPVFQLRAGASVSVTIDTASVQKK